MRSFEKIMEPESPRKLYGLRSPDNLYGRPQRRHRLRHPRPPYATSLAP